MITELLDSDAVDYDNSDDEDSDQLSIDEITGSVKQRTISVDSYKAEKQDSRNRAGSASSAGSPKRLPSVDGQQGASYLGVHGRYSRKR